jgi:1-deoxy-D-xylulose-5-phosphate synthase
MFTCQNKKLGAVSIRYPRGRGFNRKWKNDFKEIEIGKGQKLIDGKEIAIISIGHVSNFAIEASKVLKPELEVSVYDMRFLKPYDEEMLHDAFSKHKHIISVEDGTVIGGLGSLLTEFKNEHNYTSKIHILGIPDEFIEHGTPSELYALCGYDATGIIYTIKSIEN